MATTPLGLPLPVATDAPRVDQYLEALGNAAALQTIQNPLLVGNPWYSGYHIDAGVGATALRSDTYSILNGPGTFVIIAGFEIMLPEEAGGYSTALPQISAFIRCRPKDIIGPGTDYPTVWCNTSNMVMMAVHNHDPIIEGDGITVDIMTSLNDVTFTFPYVIAQAPYIVAFGGRSAHVITGTLG